MRCATRSRPCESRFDETTGTRQPWGVFLLQFLHHSLSHSLALCTACACACVCACPGALCSGSVCFAPPNQIKSPPFPYSKSPPLHLVAVTTSQSTIHLVHMLLPNTFIFQLSSLPFYHSSHLKSFIHLYFYSSPYKYDIYTPPSKRTKIVILPRQTVGWWREKDRQLDYEAAVEYSQNLVFQQRLGAKI